MNYFRVRFMIVACAVVVAYSASFAFGASSDDKEPAEVTKCRRLIDSEKDVIAFFSHPTADFRSAVFNRYKTLGDGYSVKYTFNWVSLWTGKEFDDEFSFVVDANGKLDFIQIDDHSGLIGPFQAADLILGKLKDELRKNEDVQNNRALMKLLNKSVKEVLESYLRRDIAELVPVVKAITNSGK